MRRSDTLIKIVGILLFVAFLAYMGVYALRALKAPLRTAPAVESSLQRSGAAFGLVVRKEQILTNNRKYCSLSVEDGKRVAVGDALATVYDSEIALERASRMRELELEISLGEAVLAGRETSKNLLRYGAAVEAAVLDFARDISRHDLSEIDRHSLSLRSLVFSNTAADVTPENLDSLRRELAGLRNSSTSDTEVLRAELSGLFSTALDGYEHIGPGELENLTPDGLRALIDKQREIPNGAYGKLVTDFKWYFAAVMQHEDAKQLREGTTASLDFGRYYSSILEATVVSVGSPDNSGQCAVVFSCNRAMADTLAMRQVSADVVFEKLSGIRVPYEAVHTENGQAFVYTVTGLMAEKKNINIIGDTGKYYLVETGGELRVGNDIILGGKDLYDGKVLE